MQSRWHGLFWDYGSRYYTRQGTPCRYWLAVILFISIGSVVTLLGIWFLLKGAITS